MHGFGKREMNNPWEEIKLDAYQVNTAMIFGIAGGNGLEHVSKEKYQIVYGVDIVTM